MKTKLSYLLLLLTSLSFSQNLLKGEVTNEVDFDGIHVFNKTHSKYTITDEFGKFQIEVQLNDTLVLSALQYELKEIIITEEVLQKYQHIVLKAKVNELDVVYIMPKLSGNLLMDTQSIKTKNAVTAKTLGLPNAHVIPPTQAERKVYVATSTSIDAIINAISGRTKMLKQLVKWEKKSNLEENVHANFEEIIQDEFKIPKNKVYDFIFYSSQDKLFSQIIKTNSSMIIYEFLQSKSIEYLKLQAQK